MMHLEIPLAVCLTAVTLATWLPMTSADIFTSSLKVERMVTEEEQLLTELKHYIDSQYERLKTVTSFYQDRMNDVRGRGNSELVNELKHPNAVFSVINKFVLEYSKVLGDHFDMFQRGLKLSSFNLADWNDIRGARLSLIRLQSVYNLKALDMAKGDYLGFQGPKLDPLDAYEIGQTAFTEGKLKESLEWLNASLTLYSERESTSLDSSLRPLPSVGTIKALMGRVHTFAGNTQWARSLYDEARRIDPGSNEVSELYRELQTQPRLPTPNPVDYFQNFSKLCSLENGIYPAEPSHPLIVCRYRPGYLPYYRFKEEILSITPFASVVYNVITEDENQHFRDHVKNKLKRGEVGGDNSVVSDIRTSDLAWIWDHESAIAKSVAKRVEYITGLDTTQRGPERPASSEAFQVVNYGLGGHYEVHMDPFDKPSSIQELKFSGERIATFLIYLSDVQKGGATVFTRAGVAVAPIKNMALLWYNYDPAHQRDDLTHHAGCPVLIGQKWIANKWIWTYGNTLRRRCGLSPNATQLDIEPDMIRGYQ